MKTLKEGSVGFLAMVSLISSLGGFLFGFDTAVISGTTDFVEQFYHLNSWLMR